MKIRIGIAAAVALAASIATPSPAAPGGTPIGKGAKVSASIDIPSDADAFLLEAPEGSRIAVSVKGTGASPLLPTLELERPDGSSANLSTSLSGESTTAVSLAGLRAQSTGTHRVTVKGFQGATGGYAATFQVLVDAKVVQALVIPKGRAIAVEFAAWEGAAATFSVKEMDGPALGGARLLDPAGDEVAGSEAARKGSTLAAKGVALAVGSGLYAVALEGSSAGDTTVALKVSVRSPKAKALKVKLGAEPRIAALAPPTGRDGTAFQVSGTGFAAGCRVYFDGSYEAADLAHGTDGSLSGEAPACPLAQAGGDASVTVVNPDGQTGTLERGFRYLGVPLPQIAQPSVSPPEGGTVVTLTGSGFRAGLSVLFGGEAATGVAILTGGRITCVTPAHASGPVAVQVVDEYGRPGGLPAEFQYADAPAVEGASPSAVPSFGGRTVTLAGTEFVPGDRVFVGGVEAGGVQVPSRTSLTFVTPAAAAGVPEIEVRDPLGRSWTGSGLLALSDSFHDLTASKVPSAGAGSMFPGASLVLGDLTGDGRPDLVVAAPQSRTNTITGQPDPAARILVGDGSGGFTDGSFSLLPGFFVPGDTGQADALAAGDLDGDGLSEVLVTRERVLLSREPGGTYAGYPATFHMGDAPETDWATVSSTRLWAAGGSGALQDATDERLVANPSTPALGAGDRWQGAANALGDLDGDGSLDLLVLADGGVRFGFAVSTEWTYEKRGSYYYGYYYVPVSVSVSEEAAPAPSLRVILNDGLGALVGPVPPPFLFAAEDGTLFDDFRGVACAIGDVDGDGLADAVVLSDAATKRQAPDGSLEDAPALRVLLNEGGGWLRFSPESVPDGHAASGDHGQGAAVALADLDGDGDNDVVVGRDAVSYWTDGSGAHLLPALRIFRNDGSGGLSEDTAGFLDRTLFDLPSAATVLGARALAIADVDGNGSPDLVLTGRETSVPDVAGGKGPNGLLPAGKRSATRVFLNDGAGRLADATADRVPPPVSGDLLPGDALALRDLDDDGRLDLVISVDYPPAEGRSPVRVLLAR